MSNQLLPRRVRAGALTAAALLLAPVTALPAQAGTGAPARWVVTTDGPDGPVFTSVEAPTAAGARLRTEGAVAVERDTRVAVADGNRVRAQQWALNRLAFERAWAVTRGEGVVVGVVDSGVDETHPDLAGRVLPGWTFNRAGEVSRRGQRDEYGHGTHAAGIVAAAPRGGTGLSGGAPAARILPVRVLDEAGQGWSSDVANGIVWAANRGARVLNLSFGSTTPSKAVTAAVAYARSRGAVVVAAAGNDGADGPLSYPAALPGVLAVGAVDPGDNVVPFSSTGPHLGISGPGQSVLSAVPRAVDASRLASRSGTSMAAPYVSAAAALVLAKAPALTGEQVVAHLQQTALDLGPAGRDDGYGAGLVDPARAVGEAPSGIPGRLAAPTGLAFAELPDGSTQLSWQPVEGARSYVVLHQGLPLNLDTEAGADPVYVLRGTTALLREFPRGLPISLQVVAVDARGLWSPPSAVLKALVEARPVPTPRGFKGHSPGSRTVRLSWQPVTARGLIGYGILRNGQEYDLVDADVHTFTDSVDSRGDDAPYDGRRYSYRVVAISEDGVSDPSAPLVARSFTPWATTAPTLTTRAAGGEGVTVSWSAPVAGQGGWRVYVNGNLAAVVPARVRSTTITRPGRHNVTVVRYRAAHDQGPRRTVTITVR